MNHKALVFAVAAACLTSGAAFAQTYDQRHDRNDGDQRSARMERTDGGDHDDRNDYRHNSERRDYRHHDGYGRNDRYDRHDRYDRYERSDRREAYGYGQQQYRMREGERLTQYNRGDYYVVSDWRSRRLHAPQRGYQWVQAGNDVALVAIATGIIASVLLNH
ncbi:MAG: RcnB family protein [Pseudomonadota bacterium]